MLIVADGESVRDLLPPADPSIRLIEIDETRTIGEKRNFANGQARGEVIVHWDDDDRSSPGRLADQITRLETSGKQVTGYCSMRFTDGKGWWRFRRGGERYALGTSLCYRKSWWERHPFKAKQIGEDEIFRTEADRAKEIICVDAGEMMYATIHPENTSKRQLTETGWSKL